MSITRIAAEVSNEPKIQLTLILQTQKLSYDPNQPDKTSKARGKEVIYSQCRIMRTIATSYRDAAIVAEGNSNFVDSKTGLREEDKEKFRYIFPNFQNLKYLDFNQLTYKQQVVLYNNQALTILLYLDLIQFIYPSQKNETTGTEDDKKNYLSTLSKNLRSYPNLMVKAFKGWELDDLFYKCIRAKDRKEFDSFISISRANIPGIFSNREKSALDFVISASEKSGKKQVVLVFGRDHLDNFKNLLNTIYADRIELVKVIDSTNGFINPRNILWIDELNQQAISDFKLKKYEDALFNFRTIAEFWYACEASIADRANKLLSVEYYIGSCLLQLSIQNAALLDALQHLEIALDLAKENLDAAKIQKYSDWYHEAFYRKISTKNPVYLTPADLPLLLFKPKNISAPASDEKKSHTLQIGK